MLREINDGIVQFMRRKGYESVDELVGVALKHIHDRRKVEVEELAANIDVKPCTLCQEYQFMCIQCDFY